MNRLVYRPLRTVLVLGAFAACAWASPAPQGFAGPFAEGLRWVHAADLSTPWIPTRVSFAAQGELVWVGTEVANKQLLLIDASQGGVVQPSFQDPGVAGASGILEVAAGSGGDRLFALAQYPEPDLFHRRTVVTRHDALRAGGGMPFSPIWEHPLSFLGNGPALLAADDDGQRVAVAAVQDSQARVRVELLDGATGAALRRFELAGLTLDGLALAGNGERLALAIDDRLLVLDAAGNTLHDELLAGNAGDLALDHEGARLVLGTVAELRVYDFDGAAYQLVAAHAGGSQELASRVALSRDGTTYAVAWWRFLDPDSLRCEVYDGTAHALVNQGVQNGQLGGLQNAPAGLAMTPDGRRVAFASWGKGDAEPEVVLLERGVATPLLEIDLPGSALGVDLDPRGERLIVVTKNLHANQVGSTGEVRLYDTGERDLELEAPARLGGTLEVISQEAGSQMAFFLVGPRAAKATTLPGTQGLLQLDRALRLRVFPSVPDAQGVAQLVQAIPAVPALSGTELSVQVAHRVGSVLVLSETVLDPLFY